jgi:hypothetical protein
MSALQITEVHLQQPLMRSASSHLRWKLGLLILLRSTFTSNIPSQTGPYMARHPIHLRRNGPDD